VAAIFLLLCCWGFVGLGLVVIIYIFWGGEVFDFLLFFVFLLLEPEKET